MKRLVSLIGLLILTGCKSHAPEPKPSTPARSYFTPDPNTAGVIRGTVRFRGRKPAVRVISMDAEEACQKLHPKPVQEPSLLTGAHGELANALVYVRSGLEGKTFAPPKETVVLDQRGCMFVPRVLALQTGQTLAVKNSDPVSHNIHPRPVNNHEWNHHQPPGAPDLLRRFARPEVVIPVKCNVHHWMRAYVAVLDHPYFHVTGPTGEFLLRNVPPGQYTLAVWHEILGEQTQTLTLPPHSEQPVNFVFETAPAPNRR
jgi:plastocyanin